MNNLQITTGFLGMTLAILIIYLLRRNHLYVLHGLFWITTAGFAVVLGFWPGLVDRLSGVTGISYPPALLLLVASMVLCVKALHADMVNTQMERQLRRLNQRLAMLELELHQQQKKDKL